MEKAFIRGLGEACNDWMATLSDLPKFMKQTTNIPTFCQHILLKLNAVLDEVGDATLILQILDFCCDSLTQNTRWKDSDDKNKLNLAKILCHVIVKAAIKQPFNTTTCFKLCDLLCAVVSDSWMDDLSKDRQSVAGHVYKSLWNLSINTQNLTPEQEVLYPLKALQLAIASSCVGQPCKLIQQLHVTVAAIPKKVIADSDSLLKELSLLAHTALSAALRMKEDSDWLHLLLYCTCVKAIYHKEERLPDSEVLNSLKDFYSTCSFLFESFKNVGRGAAICKEGIRKTMKLLGSCSNSLEIQAVSLMLTFTSDAVNSSMAADKSVRVHASWASLIRAQVICCRKQYEIMKTDPKTSSYYLSKMWLSVANQLNLAQTVIDEKCDVVMAADLLMQCSAVFTEANNPPLGVSSKHQQIAQQATRLIQTIGKEASRKDNNICKIIQQFGVSVLSIYSPSDSDDSLLVFQRSLSDTLAKQGLFVEALEFFRYATCLPVSNSFELIKDWVKTKKRARITHSDVVAKRVLAADMHIKEPTVKEEDLFLLALTELNEWSIKECYVTEIYSCLDALELYAVSPVHKAIHNLCRTEIHIKLNRTDRDIQSVITDGLDNLRSSTTPVTHDLVAQFYVWKFMLEYKLLCGEANLDSMLAGNHDEISVTTYKCETQALDLLYKAFDNWNKCKNPRDSENLYNAKKTAECLDMLAHLLFLFRRLKKCLDVVNLASSLVVVNLIPFSLRILKIKVLTDLGLTGEANGCLEQLLCDNSDRDSQDLISLQKSQLLLHYNKVKEAIEILETLLTPKRNTLEGVFVTASCHKQLLEILLHNTCADTKLTLMHHAWRCQREYSSLLKSMASYSMNCYSTKMIYLDAIMSSHIVLGSAYLFAGCVREADCFGRSALSMAKYFRISLRVAEIGIFRARLDMFVGDSLGSEAHIRHVHSTLASNKIYYTSAAKPDTHGKKEHKSPKSTSAKSVRAKSGSTKLGNVSKTFGFESDEDDSFKISQPNKPDESEDEDAEYKKPKYGRDMSIDMTASPSFKRKHEVIKYTDDEIFSHPADCDCMSCEEHVLHIMYLQLICDVVQTKLQKGQLLETTELIDKTLVGLGKVEERFIRRFNVSNGCISPLLQRSKIDLTYLMMKTSLLRNDTVALESARNQARPKLTMTLVSMKLAELDHLCFLPHVLRFLLESQSCVDSKTQNSTQHNEVPVLSPQLNPGKTRNASNSPPAMKRIPQRKTRRAVQGNLKLAFDDSEEESAPESTDLSVKNIKKSTQPKNQESLSNAFNALSIGDNKKKITIFCDENETPNKAAKSKELKRKPRTRNQGSVDSNDSEVLQPIRTRQSKSAAKEFIRATSTSESSDFLLPIIEEVPIVQPRLVNDDLDLPDIEISRGDDERVQQGRRKFSDTESARSARHRNLSSSSESTFLSDAFQTAVPSQSEFSCDQLIGHLECIWKSINLSRPYLLYRQVCQALAALYYNKSDMWHSAFYLCEAQAITFMHKSQAIESARSYANSKLEEPQSKTPVLSIASNRTLNDFKQAIHNLPNGWVMVSIHVISPDVNSPFQQVYISRLERDGEPVVILCNKIPQPQLIWKEFADILSASKDSMSEPEKNLWWKKRMETDKRLKNLLNKTQKELDVCRALLFGYYADTKSQQIVNKYVELVKDQMAKYNISCNQHVIKTLVNAGSHVSNEELQRYFCFAYPQLSADQVSKISKLIKEAESVPVDTRLPVILSLDKDAHSFCWESMPCLDNHAVYRMPCLYAVQAFLQSVSRKHVYSSGVDSAKTFYILNPDSNLPESEKHFTPIFTEYSDWNGITARKPTADEYKTGLSNHDLFIFIGHGSGIKYLKARELSLIDCRAAVLLMGCSSGAFDSRGFMEPSGIIYDYFSAQCASVLACLWDVTDKDIDRYTHAILKSWLTAKKQKTFLGDHIAPARKACKLPYLVGSASVIYGLPVFSKPH